MKYKLCILAAGVGSRMGDIVVNKAIVPVDGKAVISHIIDKIDKKVEIVIAVGHKKETIKDYLSLAYPTRKITYVPIDKYVGPGTGPGYSLLKCKNKLQCPFILSTADTIVEEEISPPYIDWMGVSETTETEKYLTVKIDGVQIVRMDDKTKNDNKYACIGLIGINSYKQFFNNLETNKELIKGEVQFSNGFKGLQFNAKFFTTWIDTGSKETYDFGKTDEFIYFVDGKVIKYFANIKRARDRVKRVKYLRGTVPEVQGKGNFYSYTYIPGQVLYNVLDENVMKEFLVWLEKHLWKKEGIPPEIMETCKDFYVSKTSERLLMFYRNTKVKDETKEIIRLVNWNDLVRTPIPSTFHGDLQPDNVIYNEKKFTLIDWRQDFGGLLDVGDLYYDLAKLYGGLTINYRMIKEGKFKVELSDDKIYYDFDVNNNLIKAKEVYEKWLKEKGYDLNKIKTMTAMIFLNMAPYHHPPFNLLLYSMGKDMLHKLKEESK